MPLNCPLCKADNAAGPSCRRCKADLAMLFALEDQRAAALAQSRRSFELGNLNEAKQFGRTANELRRDRDSLRWLSSLLLLAGDFGEAWQSYQSAKNYG
jgi:hypothetical protein